MVWSGVAEMNLKITTSVSRPSAVECDVLAVPVFCGRKIELPFAGSVQETLKQKMRKIGFKGAWGTAEVVVFPAKGVKASLVALVGLGDSKEGLERKREGMRRGIGRVVNEARRHGARQVAVMLAHLPQGEALAAAVVSGIELASYRFVDYSSQARKEVRSRALRQAVLLVKDEWVRDVKRQVRDERKILEGVRMARDLVNQPAAKVRPITLVDKATDIACRSNDVSITVFNKTQARRRGFTAFLAVARGSKEEPYVIHLKYRSEELGASAKKVFIVGKGITFDSGGLSLKPAKNMEAMKSDMAGAATVLGLFSVLSEIGPAVEVHGVIAACENMPSGEAYRPGDILQAKNGKTIEVLNTDAEGRITLADALSYAVEQEPDAIIDVATLTGACVVALGETQAGLWSNDDKLCKQLLKAAEKTGEGLVNLPMPQEYRQMIDSKVADIRNTSLSEGGGAITAALFLREFVGDVPWAHIDIAGAGYAEREWLPYFGVGATGYGVRTLLEFIKEYR